MNNSLQKETIKNLETYCTPKTVQKIRQIHETPPEAYTSNPVKANQDIVGRMISAKIPPHIVLYIKTGNLSFLQNPEAQKALAKIKKEYLRSQKNEDKCQDMTTYDWDKALLSFTMEDVRKMMAISRIN